MQITYSSHLYVQFPPPPRQIVDGFIRPISRRPY